MDTGGKTVLTVSNTDYTNTSSSSEEEPKRHGNAFEALLLDSTDESNDSSTGEQSSGEETTERVFVNQELSTDAFDKTATITTAKATKRGNKERKFSTGKEKSSLEDATNNLSDSFLDSLISTKSEFNGPSIKVSSIEYIPVDLDWLDPSTELKRKIQKRQEKSIREKNLPKGPFKVIPLLLVKKLKWPPVVAKKVGLEILVEDCTSEHHNEYGSTIITLVPNDAFMAQYEALSMAIQVSNLSLVMEMLRQNPLNPDILLCLAQASINFDHADLVPGMPPMLLIQRTIHILEKCLSMNEQANRALYSKNCCVPYNSLHNRKLHLALFAYIQLCIKQGCWRTGYQIAKVLYSLDPEEDMLMSRLFLDFFTEMLSEQRLDFHNDLWLPSIRNSERVRHLLVHGPSPSDNDDKENLQNLPMETHAKELYCRLLAARLKPLYSGTFKTRPLPPLLVHASSINTDSLWTLQRCASVYRHAILAAGQLGLKWSLPSQFTEMSGFMSLHDPLPPEDIDLMLEAELDKDQIGRRLNLVSQFTEVLRDIFRL